MPENKDGSADLTLGVDDGLVVRALDASHMTQLLGAIQSDTILISIITVAEVEGVLAIIDGNHRVSAVEDICRRGEHVSTIKSKFLKGINPEEAMFLGHRQNNNDNAGKSMTNSDQVIYMRQVRDTHPRHQLLPMLMRSEILYIMRW